MSRLTLPLWLVVLFLGSRAFAYGDLPPGIPANDPYAAAGYLRATLYPGVDPTGQVESTAGLQQALDDGYEYGLAVLLPAGTYLVDDTLQRVQHHQEVSCGEQLRFTPNSINKSPILVGEPGATRPLIKLKNGSDGFDAPAMPKPVVYFYNDGPQAEDFQGHAACGFGFVLRGIDIDLGTNNPGAVGVTMASAQYSTIEDVKVTATGAFAGFRGVPTTGVVVNIEVEGGQYGIIPLTCCGISLVGVKLRNQVTAGLWVYNWSAIMVTGFDIEEGTAVPILNSQYRSQTSELALLDGVIKITGSGSQPAISNLNGHSLWMSNVYVNTPGVIVLNRPNVDANLPGAGIKRVDEYSYTATVASTFNNVTHRAYTLIDGAPPAQAQIASVASVSSVPTTLMSRHLFGRIPWFNDPGVVDVTTLGAIGNGKTDSTAAIQAAINQSDYVFLPRGDYVISNTLQLNANTRLFGVNGIRSRLTAPHWNPAGQLQPFVRTPDTATGSAYLGDIRMILPPTFAQSYLSGIDWRAGRNSIVRQVSIGIEYEFCTPEPTCWSSAGRKLVHIRNNGGGRWYGLNLLQDGNRRYHTEFRGLFIDGTTEPLTLYGPNPEHQLRAPFFEINDAENVRVLGLKTEQLSYLITGSHNILFAAQTSNGNVFPTMKVIDSTNIEIPLFTMFMGQGSSNGTVTEPGLPYILYDGTHNSFISGDNRVSLFKLGNFDPTPFEPAPATLAACRAPAAITIDGSGADWNGGPATFLPFSRAVTGGGTPDNDADSSALFRLKWDLSNLYVLVEVRDNAIAGTGNVWVNDGVELYLDGGHERAGTFDNNDYQLTVDWRNVIGGTRSSTLTFAHAVATTAQGYNVEYSVPWSALRTPTSGEVIGFDIGINDEDGNDGVRDSQIVWHGNGTGWSNPTQFDAMLIDAALCY